MVGVTQAAERVTWRRHNAPRSTVQTLFESVVMSSMSRDMWTRDGRTAN